MKPVCVILMMCAVVVAQSTTQTPAPAAKAAPAATAAKAPAKAPAAKAQAKADLLNPASLKEKTPSVFVVRLETTKGNIDIRVVKNWAPNGADRFYNLVVAGFYDNCYFFRIR